MTGMRISPKLETPLLDGGTEPAPARGGAALADQIRALENAARIPTRNAWSASMDLRDARNAHSTNLVPELRAAIAGPYDWFEGDIRMRGSVPVMAHDVDQVASAMRLEDWIHIGAASGRGLKLDLKDSGAVTSAIRLLEGAKLPDERVLFNVSVGLNSPAGARVSSDDLRRIRAAFPSATINLDPGPAPYDPREIAHVTKVAEQVGGKVMFPLDAKAVPETDAGRALVATLRKFGKVAIWNSPATFAVPDRAAAERRFRAMGVDGTIDLRGANGAARIR